MLSKFVGNCYAFYFGFCLLPFKVEFVGIASIALLECLSFILFFYCFYYWLNLVLVLLADMDVMVVNFLYMFQDSEK